MQALLRYFLGMAGLLGAVIPPSVHAAAPVRPLATSGKETQLLPAVRRIGLSPISTNLRSYRDAMQARGSTSLAGVAGSPLDEDDFITSATLELTRVGEDLGRFWILPPHAPDRQSEPQKRKVARDYDLDAWLETDLTFSPEHTRLRLSLWSAGNGKRLLVREDLLLAAEPDTQALTSAYGMAFSRLMGTLGHEGRVTSMQDDLVTLDFGKERGLVRGDRVRAGVVILAARHPATGEALRWRRFETHELEVWESHEGSSLCRILRRDDGLLAELGESQGAREGADPGRRLTLLAWRADGNESPFPGSKSGRSAWREALATEAKPLVDSAEQGFARLGQKRRVTSPGETRLGQAPQAPMPPNALPGVKPSPASPPRTGGESGERPSDEGEETGETRESGGARPDSPSNARFDDPATWVPLSARVGIGASVGVVTTDKARSSGFPASVVNTGLAEADIVIDASGVRLLPQLSYSSFSSKNVNGSLFTLGLGGVMPLWHEGTDGESEDASFQSFSAGAATIVDVGDVRTIRVRSDRTIRRIRKPLDQFGLDVIGVYSIRNGIVPAADVRGGISLSDLFGGDFSVTVEGNLRPSKALPQELSLFGRLKTGPKGWYATTMGVQWDFLGLGEAR